MNKFSVSGKGKFVKPFVFAAFIDRKNPENLITFIVKLKTTFDVKNSMRRLEKSQEKIFHGIYYC